MTVAAWFWSRSRARIAALVAACALTLTVGPLGAWPSGCPAAATVVPATSPAFHALATYLCEIGEAMPHPVIPVSSGEEATTSCNACHAGEEVLPPSHPLVNGMTMTQCRDCHRPDGPLALPGTIHLDHTHYLAGLQCSTCHERDDHGDEPGSLTCLACHGPLDALAARSAETQPTNPHSSPHGAPFTECSLCHVQHGPPENFCATCHDFEFTVP